MTPRIITLSIVYNEIKMIRWFLRHYEQFCTKMVFFDDKSTDGTREVIKAHPKAELRDWEFDTGLDDEKFRFAYNHYYKEFYTDSDWIMFPDADELLLHHDPLKLLSETKADMIGSTGYALISPDGFPKDDGKSQIYDLVKTGVPQENYSKWICHRPTVNVTQAHGRHTYPRVAIDGVDRNGFEWPKCSGRIDMDPQFRLLHCHYVGGVEHGSERNDRNYNRANEKRFAWNVCESIQGNKDQPGTNAWVRDAIISNKLIDCVTGFVKPSEVKTKSGLKIQFGSGSNELEGWINTDLSEAAVIVDISKPLPYPDGCASHILASHMIEHVSHKEAWNFLSECHRILQPRGVVRICIPDITRMWSEITPEYRRIASKEGTSQAAIRAAVFDHGHNAAWNKELLATFLQAIGFQTIYENYGESTDSELRGIDGHGKVCGESIARTETSVVEGVKL